MSSFWVARGGRKEGGCKGGGWEIKGGREGKRKREREKERKREREFLGFRINSFWFLVYQFRVFGVPGLVQ
jgi:hypothetical protein